MLSLKNCRFSFNRWAVNAQFVVLVLFIILPSARVFFKYLGSAAELALCVYAVIIMLLCYTVVFSTKSRVSRILSLRGVIVLVGLAALIACWYIYPIADGLKEQMRGSDQDNCVILGVTHLLNMEHPYQSRSYFGNPCSTGMGILIAYMPFVYLGIYGLSSICFLFLVTYALYKGQGNDIQRAGGYLAILLSSVFFVELVAIGSDLLFIGLSLALLAVLLPRFIANYNMLHWVFLGVLTGIVASARVNFLVVIAMLAGYVFLYHRRTAFVFFGVAMLVGIVPSLLVYMSNPDLFTPLHLVAKGDQLMGFELKVFAMMLTVAGYVWSLYLVNKSAEFIACGLFASLCPSLLILSLSDLFNARLGDVATWEGANYLMPLLPLAGLMLLRLYPVERVRR